MSGAAPRLQDYRDRNRGSRVSAIVEIIPVVVVNVDVVCCVPIRPPEFRPWVHHHEPEAAVLEARVTPHHNGLARDPERVSRAEIKTEAILGNVVSAVASALGPGAMLALPIGGAALLPGAGMPLPSAVPLPTVLLLPGLRLLPVALRRSVVSLRAGIALPGGGPFLLLLLERLRLLLLLLVWLLPLL